MTTTQLPETESYGSEDAGSQPEPALVLEDLRVSYFTSLGEVKAADGVSFTLKPGERLGLVGESGSGKTTTALGLMRLIKPPGRIVSGKALVDGEDLVALDNEQMRQAKLSKISMIPQGAMNSLNPVAKVKNQIIDGLRDHGINESRSQFNERVGDLLSKVGLEPGVAEMYPHELSGGMKQRVTIAIAISMSPRLIIADEPTSALDVVVQKQIMETLADLQEELGAAILLIGHDIGLMAQFVDRLGVMYSGRIVESGTLRQLVRDPKHPYTQLLIDSLPSLERQDRKRGELRGIPGTAPSLYALPSGCTFHPRCPQAMEKCSVEEPILKVLEEAGDGESHQRQAACLLY